MKEYSEPKMEWIKFQGLDILTESEDESGNQNPE